MEEENSTKTPTKEDENPTKINHHQEEHKEESEWHQKGGTENSSWHRVMKMKVTKKTERISKTEKSTKTYRVTGDDEDQNNQFITVDKTITLPLSDAAKEDVEKSNTSNAEDS